MNLKKKIKKKKEILFSSLSLSFSFPASPTSLSARKHPRPQAFFLPALKQPAAAQPPLPPAQHRAPPFSFCA
jgi:hypothetical protein